MIYPILPSSSSTRGWTGKLINQYGRLSGHSDVSMHKRKHIRRGNLFALCSAVLFGMSAPLGKLLLSQITPMTLAGLLYIGGSAGIALITLAGRAKAGHAEEAPIRRSDWGLLGAAILSGGVIAPILLFYGLSMTSASVASLLLSTEAMLTTLVAGVIFREWIGKGVWLSALLMLAASLILANAAIDRGRVSGPALVVAACLMWGIDNNITSRLAHKNPASIARLKGLVAGVVTLVIACAAGMPWPDTRFVGLALLLGACSYGVSLVLFVYALRYIGTARTATWFQTAPFAGAVLSIIVLGDSLTLRLTISAVFMILATVLLLREHHEHEHKHEEVWHEHKHEHDEHHRHHDEEYQRGAVHTHPHYHSPLIHFHVHLPDVHHRHKH